MYSVCSVWCRIVIVLCFDVGLYGVYVVFVVS